MRLQLSLEFIIVFSFTVVVLLLIFGMIGTQRTYISNQQTFLQLQLVAQNIAQQLDAAVASGNGYSSTITLQSAFGMPLYSITISKNGVVLVYAKFGTQLIHTVAYSAARNVVTAPSLGTSTMTIQNSGGEICVDYACAKSESSRNAVQFYSEEFHAASFVNGSYISVPNTGVLNNLQSISMCGWVYSKTGATAATQGLWGKRHKNGNAPEPYGMNFSSGGVGIYTSGSSGVQIIPYTMPKDEWVFMCGVISSSPSALYINGTLQGTGGVGGGVATGANALIIGSAYPGVQEFDGMLANIQFYKSQITPADVQSLYSEGPTGSPVDPANLIAWWPLDGNAEDYSNNGNNGTVAGVLFPSLAELIANVRSRSSITGNVLVGFTTTLGSLSHGLEEVHKTVDGSARAYLTEGGIGGYAHAEATAYGGNALEAPKLIGWWPLNMRQGSIASDISLDNNTGTLSNAAWSSPAYVAGFEGSGGVDIGNTMAFGTNTVTLSLWTYPTEYPSHAEPLLTYGNGDGGYLLLRNDMNASFGLDIQNTWYVVNTIAPLAMRSWNLVTGVYNSTDMNIYVDGILENETAMGGPIAPQPSGDAWIGSNITSQYFYGKIAGVETYTSALETPDVANVYARGIASPPPAGFGLTGWWPLDYDAYDSSAYGNNGTLYGNTFYSGIGQGSDPNSTSILISAFNGLNSYVNITNSASLQILTDELGLSMGAWIALNTLPQASESIISTYPTGTTCGYRLNISSDTIEASDTCGTGYTVHYAFRPGILYNIFATVSPVWGNLIETFYVNGVEVGEGSMWSWSTSTDWYWSNLYIGSSGTSHYFKGSAGDVQIYNTALGSADIKALYDEGAAGVPFRSRNLAAWWPLDGNASDLSSGMNNGYAVNVISTPYLATPFLLTSSIGNYGVSFNGDGNIFIANTEPFTTNTATVSLWIYPASAPDSTESLLEYGSSGGAGLSLSNTMNAIFTIHIEGGMTYTASTAEPLQTGSWYMVTGTYNGIGLNIYVNGVLEGTAGGVSGSIETPSGGAWIGSGGASQYFYGNIADVQLYDNALSGSEVQGLYSSGMPEYASLSVPFSLGT